MNRTFWFALGAAAGVYGMVKARRAARNLSPDGLAARAAAVGAAARVLGTEFARGMAERETQLRSEADAQLDGPAAVPLIEAAGPPTAKLPPTRQEPEPVGHR